MTREIKFRVWDVQNKKFLWTGFDKRLSESHEDKPQDIRKGKMILPSDNNVVWQQYTGLKDKNGTEIFEGDIVEDSEEKYIIRHGLSVIEDLQFWGWSMEHIPYDHEWPTGPMDPLDVHVLEVIGNVYEHPHLLTNNTLDK